MAPLLLTQDFRVKPPERTNPQGASAWTYDVILDGLLSGNLSGQPVDPQDAQLLVTLLSELGWEPDANELAGAMPYFVQRLEIGVLRALMRNLGYDCTRQCIRGDALPHDRLTAVVSGSDGRVWSVDASDTMHPKLVRPRAGITRPEYERIQRRSRYDMVMFSSLAHPINVVNQATRPSFSLDIFARLSPDLRLAILLTLLSGAFTVAFSVTVIFLFNLVVSHQQPAVVIAVLVASGALFLSDLVFRGLKARLLGKSAGRFEFLLGSALFDKLLRLPGRMVDQAPISDQTLRMRELEGMKDFFAGPFAILALEFPVTVILISAIAVFSPLLALVLVAVIFAFMATCFCLVPSLIRRAASLSLARASLTRAQMELITRREAISRNGLAWPWYEKAERAINRVVAARLHLSRATSLLEALSYLCMPVAAGCVIFIGAELVIGGALSGGELVASTMLTWRAIAPVQQSLLIMPKVGDLLRLFRQIDAMMRFPEEEIRPEPEKETPEVAGLSAANIFLRRANAHGPTLAGVDLEIPHGLLVAVTGASGSGKSTLLGVLSGQIQPQAGTVRLGDMNLSEFCSHALGRRIVLIPQRPMLIYGTLAQNLRFVDPLISDSQIETALTEVGLGTLLVRLPEGINSRIDPTVDTTVLTGGVRTAIAVAQALLIKPSVLLIDEAAEDLDPAIDTAVLAALQRRSGQMTSLVATHRPSVMRASDAILNLSGGRTRLAFHENEKDLAV